MPPGTMSDSPPRNPTPSHEPWTIRRVLGWAIDDFRSRGIDSARLDAELLLAFALGTDRLRLILDAMRPLNREELGGYRELIRRRRMGEPVAYILGQREFYGLAFHVDARVLIPRPDTEALVEVALERTDAVSASMRALDLCTGSGCVAIAFAAQRPAWEVTGADLSEDALRVARDNASRLEQRVRFVVGDLFDALGAEERYDLVTANAPYIPSAEIPTLDKGIREFEPRLALVGGGDGLEVIRRVIRDAPARLRQNGVLALEVGYDQAPRVAALMAASGFDDIRVRRDYGGHERVVSGVVVTRSV